MKEKAGILNFVKKIKKLFVVFSCIAIPAILICLVFAVAHYVAYWIITAVIAVGYFVVYGFYLMRVSLGTVVGVEMTDKVIHLKTPRRTYTYDVRSGCVGVKVKKNVFVATFRTQDSEDKFYFRRRVLFSKYYEEQFTIDEMREIYPALQEDPA